MKLTFFNIQNGKQVMYIYILTININNTNNENNKK